MSNKLNDSKAINSNEYEIDFNERLLPYDNLEQCLKIFSTEGEEDARRGDGDKEQRNGEEVEQAARDVGG